MIATKKNEFFFQIIVNKLMIMPIVAILMDSADKTPSRML